MKTYAEIRAEREIVFQERSDWITKLLSGDMDVSEAAIRSVYYKEACDDYIHICNLDTFINKLVLLREEAKVKFGKDW